MTLTLDRADIQGNVLIPYGRRTFPMGHLLLFHAPREHSRGPVLSHATDKPNSNDDDDDKDDAHLTRARRFLQWLLPQVTTGRTYRSKRSRAWPIDGSTPLPPPPPMTVNAAFTHDGLAAFGVPPSTLAGFPVEFQQGMRRRAAVLNDDVELWNPVWQDGAAEKRIHLLILLRGNFTNALAKIDRRRGIPAAQRPATADYHRREVFEEARQLMRAHLERRSQLLINTARAMGLTPLVGHGPATDPDGARRPWQSIEALTCSRGEDGLAAKVCQGGNGAESHDLRYGEHEHFGFFDGIADPVFEGQHPPAQQAEELIGQGRLEQGRWNPLATGEFLLGYPDEAQEMPAAAVPSSFSRNGTFLVVRKLHQRVACFEREIARQLPTFRSWLGQRPSPQGDGADNPVEREEARLLLRAKLMGRWEDGTPLTVAPSYRQWLDFRQEFQRLVERARGEESARAELIVFKRQLRDLRYEPEDRDGTRCPFSAHIRRSNPRDSGDPRLGEQPDAAERQRAGSVLVNRRRILRRSLPYGPRWHPRRNGCDPVEACVDDGQERGTLFMALCGGLSRQFEFLQQQWLNYGADFGAGNDICPISGVMAKADLEQGSKLTIGAPAESARPPFVMRIAQAVECRGGGYFFVPSLTALRQIAQGLVDPI